MCRLSRYEQLATIAQPHFNVFVTQTSHTSSKRTGHSKSSEYQNLLRATANHLTKYSLYDKVLCMTDTHDQPSSDLEYASQLRRRTRIARDGSWFALIAFGVVVLAATVFYRTPISSATSFGCHSSINGTSCSGFLLSRGLFGSGLGSPAGTILNVSPWATTYWVIGIFAGICAVVAFYWLHSRSSGVVGRVWPFATIGTGILALAVASRGWQTLRIPADFWIRGMQALLVIALGLAVLAMIERSWPFALFVMGFFGLALLSCLYNVSNLFVQFGIGGTWNGNDQDLPNLILPGSYLLVGGVLFYIFRRSGVVFYIARRRTNDGE